MLAPRLGSSKRRQKRIRRVGALFGEHEENEARDSKQRHFEIFSLLGENKGAGEAADTATSVTGPHVLLLPALFWLHCDATLYG